MSRTAQHPIRTQNRHRRLATVAPVVAGLGLALLLSGCGAGQITQTDTQVAAVNGASGNAGPIAVRGAELAYPGGSAQGVYQPGSNAELIVTIVNTGVTDDTLTGISSPAAVGATIDGSASGSKDLPGGFAIIAGQDVDGQDTTATAIPLTTEEPTGSTTTPSGLPPVNTSGANTTGASGTSGLPGTSGATTTEPSTTAASAAGQLPGTAKPGTVKIMLTGIKTVNGAPLRAGLTIPITFTFAKAGQVTVDVPIAAPADNSPAVANTGS